VDRTTRERRQHGQRRQHGRGGSSEFVASYRASPQQHVASTVEVAGSVYIAASAAEVTACVSTRIHITADFVEEGSKQGYGLGL
jgi:hypothetical protein